MYLPAPSDSTTSHLPPAGLLQSLPISGCPWSHIVLAFIIGLPQSRGKTVILNVVDRFSKAVKLVALEASICYWHTQFISKVWRAFCAAFPLSTILSRMDKWRGKTKRLNLLCVEQPWTTPPCGQTTYPGLNLQELSELSPFEASLGYQPPIFSDLEPDIAVSSIQHHILRCHSIVPPVPLLCPHPFYWWPTCLYSKPLDLVYTAGESSTLSTWSFWED